jgi:hypothetical protein
MEALAEQALRHHDEDDELEDGEIVEHQGGTVATTEESPDVLVAGFAESINSAVGIRRKIVALADKEPYIGYPELAAHCVEVADLLMGTETVEKGKAGAGGRGVDRIKLVKGIGHFTYNTPTPFQKSLLEPLIAAYGRRAWLNDVATCSRSGTDFISKVPEGFTHDPVHEDWQLEAKAFPRLMSFLQKGFIIVEWMKVTRQKIAALPPSQDVDDELVQAKTHLINAKAIEAFRIAQGLPAPAASDVEWLEKTVELLEEKKRQQEEGLVEELKLRLTQEALRVGGLPAVHWSVLPGHYVKKNLEHLRVHPDDLCMKDELWPVHFGRDVDFFVSEIRKLVARVAACNVAQVAGFQTDGDKELTEDHAAAINALKKKLTEDPAAYDRLRTALDLPPSKKRRVAANRVVDLPFGPVDRTPSGRPVLIQRIA